MDEGMAPGSPFCWDVESRRDAARRPSLAPVLESRVVVVEMHGERNKRVCNPAPGCQRATGQPVTLRWSLQRSQEGTRELGTGAKGTRSKRARARYAGSSRDGFCTEAGDAHRCLPVPWEHWKPKRVLDPWVLGGHPVGSLPVELGCGADGDAGDGVPAAGLARSTPRMPAVGIRQTWSGR